jgi:hypothetical protein
MRFSIKSLLVLSTLVATALAIARYSWMHWPAVAHAAAIGLLVWVYFRFVRWGAGSQELPRNAGIVLGGVATGVAVMLAYRYSPSFVATALGFLFVELAWRVSRQVGPQFLTWAGVEAE